MDARGDVDAVALGLLGHPAARAGRAGVVDDRALATAFGAGLGDGEKTLALGVDPGALAAWTRPRRGAGLRPAAVAGRALARGGHGDGDLRAVHRLVEGEP